MGTCASCRPPAGITDAQIAETTYTAFEGARWAITARLIVRRVKRLNPVGAENPVRAGHAAC